MGLDANYPAVRINNPQATVTVYNQDHVPIGTLGPDDSYHSAAVNVACITKRWDDDYWYRLLNPDGFHLPASSAWIPAAEVHVFTPDKPVPDCANVGCLRKSVGPVAATTAAGAASVWWWRRRRRP